jgi:hypothetical protein
MERKIKTLAEAFGTERCMHGAGAGEEHRCPNPPTYVGPGEGHWCAEHRIGPPDKLIEQDARP